MTTHVLTIEVAASQIITSNNERGHWAKRSGVKATMRHLAQIKARAARLPQGIEKAHITVWVDYPDRRRRDILNLYPTAKCHIDGLVDAGVILDDSDTHLTGPDFRPTGAITKGKYVFHYHIKEVN